MASRILTVIPARGGSKSIPRKNLQVLGGRPLIAWSIGCALDAGLEDVVVSTDDSDIARVALDCGASVPFIRPAELGRDESPMIEVLQHTLSAVDREFDALLLLQPTSPLRQPQDVKSAIGLYERLHVDTVISVTDVGGMHPARMAYLEDGYLVKPSFAEPVDGLRRQDLPKMFIRNGAIYLIRSSCIREGTLFGMKTAGLVMPRDRSLNIDDPFDLELARMLVSAHA